MSITDSVISLKDGNIANILNRAFVIHEGPEDFANPCGTCGQRISCGINGSLNGYTDISFEQDIVMW